MLKGQEEMKWWPLKELCKPKGSVVLENLWSSSTYMDSMLTVLYPVTMQRQQISILITGLDAKKWVCYSISSIHDQLHT